MGRMAERLAEQAFGRCRVAQGRQQKVDCGARRIDRAIEVAPATLDANVRLIDAPGPVGRLEVTAEPLLQFGAITLHPAPEKL